MCFSCRNAKNNSKIKVWHHLLIIFNLSGMNNSFLNADNSEMSYIVVIDEEYRRRFIFGNVVAVYVHFNVNIP